MTKIKRVAFSVSWTTPYTSILDGSVAGMLASRQGYLTEYQANGAVPAVLPWYRGPDRPAWSWFWGKYVGAPEQLRKPSPDSAWERVVPVRWNVDTTVTDGPGTEASVDVWIYPCAISVLIHVHSDGDWPLDQVANAVMTLRRNHGWTLQTPKATIANQTLDGIATAVRNEAAALLTDGPAPQPSADPTRLTVAAPVIAEGDPAALDVTDKTVSACLVGLSALGPPGVLDQNHLLDINSDPNCMGRVYLLNAGHAIWHTAKMLEASSSPKAARVIECLQRNHIDLVTHIEALGEIVSWTADRVQAHVDVPVTAQRIGTNAATRLGILLAGDRKKTYRSEVAKRRIDPLATSTQQVAQAF